MKAIAEAQTQASNETLPQCSNFGHAYHMQVSYDFTWFCVWFK